MNLYNQIYSERVSGPSYFCEWSLLPPWLPSCLQTWAKESGSEGNGGFMPQATPAAVIWNLTVTSKGWGSHIYTHISLQASDKRAAKCISVQVALVIHSYTQVEFTIYITSKQGYRNPSIPTHRTLLESMEVTKLSRQIYLSSTHSPTLEDVNHRTGWREIVLQM